MACEFEKGAGAGPAQNTGRPMKEPMKNLAAPSIKNCTSSGEGREQKTLIRFLIGVDVSETDHMMPSNFVFHWLDIAVWAGR